MVITFLWPDVTFLLHRFGKERKLMIFLVKFVFIWGSDNLAGCIFLFLQNLFISRNLDFTLCSYPSLSFGINYLWLLNASMWILSSWGLKHFLSVQNFGIYFIPNQIIKSVLSTDFFSKFLWICQLLFNEACLIGYIKVLYIAFFKIIFIKLELLE